MINIFESLFILALDDEEGDFAESIVSILEPALAGAVLAELVLLSRIELVDNRVVVTDQTHTELPILDNALFEILDTTKPRKLKYWINTLISKKIIEEIGQHLVLKELLVRKKKRLRLTTLYGESHYGNVSAKLMVKKRLREIVMEGQEPELFEKVLLTFLYHAEFDKLVFTHGERKAAHKRMKKLITNEEGVSILGETLDEIVAVSCDSKD